METLERLWRGGKVAFLTVAGWLAVYATALAQQGQQFSPRLGHLEKKEGGDYVTSYALALAAIGLALLLICRTSNRRDRARPEQYAESEDTATE